MHVCTYHCAGCNCSFIWINLRYFYTRVTTNNRLQLNIGSHWISEKITSNYISGDYHSTVNTINRSYLVINLFIHLFFCIKQMQTFGNENISWIFQAFKIVCDQFSEVSRTFSFTIRAVLFNLHRNNWLQNFYFKPLTECDRNTISINSSILSVLRNPLSRSFQNICWKILWECHIRHVQKLNFCE